MDRRSFLKSYGSLPLVSALGGKAFGAGTETGSLPYFGLHPFIEAHPEAVFLRKTAVASKDDAEAKKKAGLDLAQRIFSLHKDSGLALSGKLAFKPNLTGTKNTGLTYGIVTDPYLVEGLVEGAKNLKFDPNRIYMREGLGKEQPVTGFSDMARRTGVHYGDDDSREPTTMECPNGVVFRRTKYLGPFGHEDSLLINVAKMKTHSMGLTLCVKNLQGTNIPPYIRFCGGVNQRSIAADLNPEAQAQVDEIFARHLKEGYPRWDTEKGAWMEMWIQRTLDHYALIKPKVMLNVIEGIYSQNGDGFDGGPSKDGTPEIFLTNMLLFGKDAFRLDIVGHWIGGQEPGNFGLFHAAKERGCCDVLNPKNIPIYLWEDDGPKLITLDKITRTPLTTQYLPRTEEAKYHLCNEPFTYPTEKPALPKAAENRPAIRLLGPNRNETSQSSMVMEYRMPEKGLAQLEIRNRQGDCLFRRHDSHMVGGFHMAEWDTARIPSGTYEAILHTPGLHTVQTFRL